METPGWLLIGLSLCALCASMERLEDGNHSMLGKKSVKRPGAPADHSLAGQSQVPKSRVMDLRMPGAHPIRPDHYICTAFPVGPDEQYITNYEALASSGIAHHVLLFACGEPAKDTPTWDCYRECKGQAKILYGWARNAPPTKLPKDVGYRIGGDTGVKYLVLQIHYKNPLSGLEGDHSGLRITLTKEKQKYIQGIFLLVSGTGHIPPHQRKVNVDVSCRYTADANIYPFGFRTHAHQWSRVVTGYQNNGSFHLIGRGNPQWPQAFYPTEEGVVIKHGDYLAARCSYNSINETRTIFMGMTHTDEMCNFYIMYYTDAATGSPFSMCTDDLLPQITSRLPADSDVPPPHNLHLEEQGEGHHTHQEAMGLIAKWPQISRSDHVRLGSVAGVAVDSKDNVHIFHRGSHVWGARTFDPSNKFTEIKKGPIAVNPLVTFNKQGAVIHQWGKAMFYMPHGLYIDGEDNIWVTDVALHQVVKFKPGSTKPALVLGKRFEPGSDDDHFCKPTDVAVLDTGEFFVSDGYCNSRIMKFSKEGKILKQWGTRSPTVGGDGMPPPSTFDIPHSLALLKDKQMLFVADRENGRIQCFDYHGNYHKQIHHPDFNGRLFAIEYDPKHGVLLAVNGPDPYNSKAEVSGFTLDADTGLILNHWQPGTHKFQNPHDIALSNSGECVYVAETQPYKIWKFHYSGSSLQSLGVHQSVKKGGQKLAGHPSAVDTGLGEVFDDKIEQEDEKEGDELNASIIVSCVLVVPVVIIVSVVVFLRVRRSAQFLNKGYQPVVTFSTDASDLPIKTSSEL